MKGTRLASTVPLPHMNPNRTWLHRSIYYLAAGFMIIAAALRALIIFRESYLLDRVLLLLAVWLIFFIGNALLAPRLPWSTAVFLATEAGLILFLLLTTDQDFFAVLFAILGMQAMQRYSPRVVGVLIGLSALLTFLVLVERIGLLQALALALIYSALGAFMAAYIWSTRRAGIVQEQQQALVGELQEANQRLEFHTRQQEQLAAGRERQRLARELHDSVTQTIFSMTLTTQSALLLLERDRGQVTGQLDRLDQLAQSALSEMQMLVSRLAPQTIPGEGFIGALQRRLEERRRVDNLFVTLKVEGEQPLDPAEEAGLFRIAQEALNNVVKHARVTQAVIRLHLSEPFWMEVEDCGAGFDPGQVRGGGRMGLAGMGERAAEIGWTLRAESSPGGGTRIRVEKDPGGKELP
jgi:signal transduction histidine kinase